MDRETALYCIANENGFYNAGYNAGVAAGCLGMLGLYAAVRFVKNRVKPFVSNKIEESKSKPKWDF